MRVPLPYRLIHPRAGRPGMASVEFVMALPLLTALLALIITFGKVCQTRCQVVIEARHEAWKGRNDAGVRAGTLPGLERGKFGTTLSPQLPHDDLVENTRTRNVRLNPGPQLRGLALFGIAETASSSRHVVMGGTWDSEYIKFTPHGRLVPDTRIFKFGPGTVVNMFEGMLDWLKNPEAVGGLALDSLFDQLEQALSPLSGALADINNAIDILKSLNPLEIAKIIGSLGDIWEAVGDLRQALDDMYGLLGEFGNLGKN